LKPDFSSQVGVVVIGRNESKNIVGCLDSLKPFGLKAVYVDSGSSDGTPDLARPLCDITWPLDPARPFSAARGRNEGFEQLMKLAPQTKYVQFLDGDCTLLDGWLEAAVATFEARPEVGVVIGHLIERHPDRSPYNALCALEWKSPAGDLQNYGALGGIMMVRTDLFAQLEGFNAKVIAGEDSEFGVRVHLAQRVVTKLDTNMGTHDANILKFKQWWTRSVRAGHAVGQRSYLNGESVAQDCVHERKSTMAWGISLPVLIVVAAVVFWPAAVVLLLGYAYLYAKIFAYRRNAGDDPQQAGLYARFTTLAKLANGWGLLKFYWRRGRGEFRIIEYK